ncbi:MAG TPA: hypothetical protein VGC91_18080 [Pyrinomonadaceae bacterium]
MPAPRAIRRAQTLYNHRHNPVNIFLPASSQAPIRPISATFEPDSATFARTTLAVDDSRRTPYDDGSLAEPE